MTSAPPAPSGRAEDAGAHARRRVGKAIRDLGHAVVGHQAPADVLHGVADTLAAVTSTVGDGAPRQRELEIGGDVLGVELPEGEPIRAYDDRPFSGLASPWGVDLEVHRRGDEIEGLLMLGAAHEGAPARAHGGIVAGLFDDVFGFVLGILQQAAFTGELTVRYEAATPLHRRLACRGRLRERRGRKIWIDGELVDLETPGQPVVARAHGLFIAVDREQLRTPTAALPAPPDEA
ncbi:MAG: hypothetical protein H0W46_04155 [Acidimicrobiia bacterium]|nr:hypothetical protein [Acidimicrobiia bacterium]